MIFEVAIGSSSWYSVLISSLCSGDRDLIVQIDWLWFYSELMGFSDWLYCSDDWFWASMLLMGPVWKFDEMWPANSLVV